MVRGIIALQIRWIRGPRRTRGTARPRRARSWGAGVPPVKYTCGHPGQARAPALKKKMTFEVEINGRMRTVAVEGLGAAGPCGGRFRARIDGHSIDVSARPTDLGVDLVKLEGMSEIGCHHYRIIVRGGGPVRVPVGDPSVAGAHVSVG